MSNNKLDIFDRYISDIDDEHNRQIFRTVLSFVATEFPELETVIKWNQPMFISHATYIIAFNVTKKHINIAPERAGMIHFDELIRNSNVGYTKMFIQMKWNNPIDYDLLKKVIQYNIIDKADTTSFWR